MFIIYFLKKEIARWCSLGELNDRILEAYRPIALFNGLVWSTHSIPKCLLLYIQFSGMILLQLLQMQSKIIIRNELVEQERSYSTVSSVLTIYHIMIHITTKSNVVTTRLHPQGKGGPLRSAVS